MRHHIGSLLNEYTGTTAVIILSVTPESKNVSEGTMVEFSCASPDTGVEFSWSTKPHVQTTERGMDRTNPDVGKLSTFSFTASAQQNNTQIICTVFVNSTSNQGTALLLVQGKPTIAIITSVRDDTV